MFKKFFKCKVFCLEPDFNTMKKNFLEKGKDALAEREKEWEEYEEEMQSIFDGEEDEEGNTEKKEQPQKPKKDKIDQYKWDEGSLDEYNELMTEINSLASLEGNSDVYYELISDDVIYSSSYNIIRNVVKYIVYVKEKQKPILRNRF